MGNFAHNKNKSQYSYVLASKGILERFKITKAFIIRKEKEYELLKHQLEEAKKAIEL